MKSSIVFSLLLAPFFVNAQHADTSNARHLKPDINNNSWCIAVNTGFQKRFFAGIGIAKTWFIGSDHGVYGADMYTGMNFYPAFKKSYNNAAGYRLGADIFGNGFFIGAEVQYLRSNGTEDWMFTPRAGAGISSLYIAYGYSISPGNKFPIAGISQNSITVQLNFPFYSKDNLSGKVTHWNRQKK